MDGLRQICIIVTALAAAGCYDSFDDRSGQSVPEPATATVAELRRLCSGTGTDITTNVVIAGRVTTSDEAGNFSRTFFVEDSTGGAEIMAGTYDIHNKYPVGATVSVNLADCTVAVENGVLQIGLKPRSHSQRPAEYFMTDVLLDRHIIRGDVLSEVVPTVIAAGDTDHCGRLVRIDGLRYTPTEPTEPTDGGTFAGYRRFVAPDGEEIYSCVREYADFADDVIPDGEVSLCGILLYGRVTGVGDRFILKPRSRNDCTDSDSIY